MDGPLGTEESTKKKKKKKEKKRKEKKTNPKRTVVCFEFLTWPGPELTRNSSYFQPWELP